MTLLYHPNIKRLFAERGIRQGLGASMTVYSGAQPTPQTVLNSWSSYNQSAAVCLWHGSGIVWSLQNSLTVYASAVATAATPLRAGSAAWCIMWGGTIVTGTGTGQLGSATIPTSRFIIGDVTTTAGSGVVRFSSINFTTSSSITFVDAGITIV